jgi:hypothetical protein
MSERVVGSAPGAARDMDQIVRTDVGTRYTVNQPEESP